jgi:excisionase family DNA binding protein
MARLHIRFRNINRNVIACSQRLFDSKPWSGTDEDKQNKFEAWLRKASEHYGIPQPTLTVTRASDVFGLVAPNTIILDKYSVTSLFHSFRAHMQYTGTVDVTFFDRQDAQAWACSLFYTCRPILFRKAVRSGAIAGVRADDLLSSASLAARQDEVDEAFAGIVAESYTEVEIHDDEDEGATDLPTDEDVQDSEGILCEDVEELTVAQAAERLNVSQSTVRNMLRDGRLQGRTEGRRVLIEFGTETPAE